MINTEEVKHIAQLARIQFSEEELKSLQKELSSILDYIDKLKEVDIKNIEVVNPSVNSENITREDKVVKQELKMADKLLEAAPQRKGRFIKVKSVF